MKVRVTETITEIEATASEINASQTLAGKLAALLSKALTPYRDCESEETEEEEDEK